MEYAIVTVKNKYIGQINIKFSRKMKMKHMICNLFNSLNVDLTVINGFYVKAEYKNCLLMQNDTLEDKEIYDGEVLKIL